MPHRVWIFWCLGLRPWLVATLSQDHVVCPREAKIRIAHGGQLLNISYPWLELPPAEVLESGGYYVRSVHTVKLSQSIQLLVADADLSHVNSGHSFSRTRMPSSSRT